MEAGGYFWGVEYTPINYVMNIYCYNFFYFSFALSFILSLSELKSLVQIFIELEPHIGSDLDVWVWQNDKICVYALWNLNWYLILTFVGTVAMKVSNVHVMSLIKVKLLDTLSVIYSIKTKYMLIELNGMQDIYTLALRLMLHITGAQAAPQDLLLFLGFHNYVVTLVG
jgi:hypothetical protein